MAALPECPSEAVFLLRPEFGMSDYMASLQAKVEGIEEPLVVAEGAGTVASRGKSQKA